MIGGVRVSAVACGLFLAIAVVVPVYGQGQTIALTEHEKAIAERDETIRALRQRLETLERGGTRAPQSLPNAPADRAVHGEVADARALERSLMREGGLVLPPKAFEIESGIIYTHHSESRAQAFRRDVVEASVTLKAGLPRRTQLELSVPFIYSKAYPEGQAGAAGVVSASGRGDVSVSLTHQMLDEQGGRPALLGTVRWNDAGSAANYNDPVAVRSSFRSLQGSLTLVKRKDPVVFFAGGGYTGYESRRIDGTLVQPGGIASLRLGSVIALRPDTSMTVGLELDRGRTTKANGVSVPDDRISMGMLQIGFGVLISPRLLLDVQASVGLTPGSPDYRLGVSLPFRF